MSVMTLDGVVENGHIRLRGDVRLPENTEVYVIVPGVRVAASARIVTPHLAHPEQARDFELDVLEEPDDASL